MNTKKVEKYQNTNEGFLSLEIQVIFERIKRVIVAAILIRGIRLFNRHIKYYMRNVTIRKTR